MLCGGLCSEASAKVVERVVAVDISAQGKAADIPVAGGAIVIPETGGAVDVREVGGALGMAIGADEADLPFVGWPDACGLGPICILDDKSKATVVSERMEEGVVSRVDWSIV